MAAARRAVLFDLDGTLTNPFLGISRSMRHALQQVGHAAPDDDAIRGHIGPPLQATFANLLGDAAMATAALGHYRQRYDEAGKFENELIPGIVEVVQELSRDGYLLSVATSKLETYSIDIVNHFGLMPFFDAVHGSQPDGSRADKGELIAHILAAEGLDPARTIMVGDRLHDLVGARRNHLAAIGVLWGFGDRAELESAGATAIVECPAELTALVKQLIG